MALGAGPNLGKTAFGVVGDARLGLDITLVNGFGVEFPLDDDLGLGKPFFDIAELAFHPRCNIRRLGRFRFDALGELIFMQDRRIGLHRIAHVDHMGQNFVFHLDQLQRLLGDGIAGRGNGSNRVTVIQHVFTRHHVPRHVAEVDHQFARCRMLNGHIREVVARDDGLYAGQCLGGGGVDRQDIGAGMRAAQHTADQLTGQADIGRIAGAPRDLVDGIAARGRVRANDLEIFFLVRNFGREW